MSRPQSRSILPFTNRKKDADPEVIFSPGFWKPRFRLSTIDSRQSPSNGDRVVFGDDVFYLQLRAHFVHKTEHHARTFKAIGKDPVRRRRNESDVGRKHLVHEREISPVKL